ncbi:MAG TPA: hypothetical protein VMZ29_16245 [Candidatus Bathyarchaeia archaeon]|nr:hypothetical protein [Candidatus Bathyarchaeia archaeon]
MSNEKSKPYTVIVLISIIIITLMSVGVMVIMSSWIRTSNNEYTETAEILNNFGNLATADIQIILEEDSAKYEIAYSYLNDLYYLNDKYKTMIEYNQTHPFNYTQQDFDELMMEFTSKMRTLISIVNSTSVFDYSANQLGANVANNYTYSGFEYYFIVNQWNVSIESYLTIHNDIRNFVSASFALSGDIIQLPKINFERWTYHLYNNLSILEFVGSSKSINYIDVYMDNLGLSLVNLSLDQLTIYIDRYFSLNEKVDELIQDLNNTLITLALAGVLMGFAISFDKINFRRISLIVGLIILVLAMIYFSSSFGTLIKLPTEEAGIIGANYFVEM